MIYIGDSITQRWVTDKEPNSVSESAIKYDSDANETSSTIYDYLTINLQLWPQSKFAYAVAFAI